MCVYVLKYVCMYVCRSAAVLQRQEFLLPLGQQAKQIGATFRHAVGKQMYVCMYVN